MAQADRLSAPAGIWKVITASSAGTLIEWYDFYIFGSLATVIATQFFPKGNPTAALLSTLATFATGFVVRPFGALVFGRMGDMIGRKVTFLFTLMMMGLSTFAIGLLPSYEQIGVFAPIILVLLRLLQGLALGGEYGGATTYIAEHAPEGRRGYFTSFIQTTATLGLFVSLIAILLTRQALGETAFADHGWRYPFLLSIVLVAFSYMIRRRMNESPLFTEIKEKGQVSKNPLRDSFVNAQNRRLVLIALFGATAGQGVVWYTSQYYALYYLTTVMNVEGPTANKIVALALLIGTPFFIFFGALSDRIGRKKLIMAGCLLAAIGYYPIYSVMYAQTDLLDKLISSSSSKIETKIDAKTHKEVSNRIRITSFEDGTVSTETRKLVPPPTKDDKPKKEIKIPSGIAFLLTMLVLVQVLFVTLVYGPIAAFLVELFPTKVRYTSMSLPYHIGNGVFGGLVPFIATALVAATKNPFAGLFYPIAVALLTFFVGMFAIRESSPGHEEAVGVHLEE